MVVTSRYSAIRAWYGSRDNLGLLFDRTLPMTLSLLLAPAGFWLLKGRIGAGEVSRPTVMRLALVAALGVMSLAMLLTFSLGAWAASLIAALAILTIRFSWGKWLYAGISGLVVLGALGSGKVGSAFAHVHGTTAARRVDIWRSSLRMIADHPIVGVGPDNFLHYYAPVHREGYGLQGRFGLYGARTPDLARTVPLASPQPRSGLLAQHRNSRIDLISMAAGGLLANPLAVAIRS